MISPDFCQSLVSEIELILFFMFHASYAKEDVNRLKMSIPNLRVRLKVSITLLYRRTKFGRWSVAFKSFLN